MGLDLQAAAEQAAAIGEAALLPVSDTTELHVDGDYAAYYFSGNDETSFGEARSNMVNTLKLVRRIAGAGGRAIVHLTHGSSDKGGRFKIATVKPYQGQRDPGRKPKNWQAMREWLESGSIQDFGTKIWYDREADDGVAAAARYAFQSGLIPGILSRDKDFQMIPGRHVSWTTLAVTETTPETWAKLDEDGRMYGQKFFWWQMLRGDPADNIPGIEGVPASKDGKFKACGEKCADDLLATARTPFDAFQIVAAHYKLYYGQAWADRFAEQAALLWMRPDNAASVSSWLAAIPGKLPELNAAAHRLERRIQ